MGAIGSFMDGRKVDRRFKNGYKNNAGSDVDPAMGVKLIKTAVACFVIAYVTQWIIDP